jgi:DNA-binding IclR family transcriptional regulator
MQVVYQVMINDLRRRTYRGTMAQVYMMCIGDAPEWLSDRLTTLSMLFQHSREVLREGTCVKVQKLERWKLCNLSDGLTLKSGYIARAVSVLAPRSRALQQERDDSASRQVKARKEFSALAF